MEKQVCKCQKIIIMILEYVFFFQAESFTNLELDDQDCVGYVLKGTNIKEIKTSKKGINQSLGVKGIVQIL